MTEVEGSVGPRSAMSLGPTPALVLVNLVSVLVLSSRLGLHPGSALQIQAVGPKVT